MQYALYNSLITTCRNVFSAKRSLVRMFIVQWCVGGDKINVTLNCAKAWRLQIQEIALQSITIMWIGFQVNYWWFVIWNGEISNFRSPYLHKIVWPQHLVLINAMYFLWKTQQKPLVWAASLMYCVVLFDVSILFRQWPPWWNAFAYQRSSAVYQQWVATVCYLFHILIIFCMMTTISDKKISNLAWTSNTPDIHSTFAFVHLVCAAEL